MNPFFLQFFFIFFHISLQTTLFQDSWLPDYTSYDIISIISDRPESYESKIGTLNQCRIINYVPLETGKFTISFWFRSLSDVKRRILKTEEKRKLRTTTENFNVKILEIIEGETDRETLSIDKTEDNTDYLKGHFLVDIGNFDDTFKHLIGIYYYNNMLYFLAGEETKNSFRIVYIKDFMSGSYVKIYGSQWIWVYASVDFFNGKFFIGGSSYLYRLKTYEYSFINSFPSPDDWDVTTGSIKIGTTGVKLRDQVSNCNCEMKYIRFINFRYMNNIDSNEILIKTEIAPLAWIYFNSKTSDENYITLNNPNDNYFNNILKKAVLVSKGVNDKIDYVLKQGSFTQKFIINLPSSIVNYVFSYWFQINQDNFVQNIFFFNQCPFTTKINIMTYNELFFQIGISVNPTLANSNPGTVIYLNKKTNIRIEKIKVLNKWIQIICDNQFNPDKYDISSCLKSDIKYNIILYEATGRENQIFFREIELYNGSFFSISPSLEGCAYSIGPSLKYFNMNSNEAYYNTYNVQKCIRCNSDYVFSDFGNSCVQKCNFKLDTKCLDECPLTHCSDLILKICVLKKNPLCKVCTIENAVETCKLCVSGYGLFTNRCILQSCSINCAECINVENCLICDSGFVLSSSKKYLCSDKCLFNEYDSNGYCQICPSECETCKNANLCLTCIDSKVLSTKFQCVDNCESNEYLNLKTCNTCPNSCLKCSNSNFCTSCISNFYLRSNLCVNKCESNEYIENNSCKKCSNNCINCKDSISCNKCANNYVLSLETHFCVDNCQFNQYNDLGFCKKCSENCVKCNNSAQCLKCDTDFNLNLLKTSCVKNCNSDEYSENFECQKCMENCISCKIKSKCDKCQQFFYLGINKTCINSCEFNQYINENECFQCPLNCDLCPDSTMCTKCSLNYIISYKNKNLCVSSCELNEYQSDGKCNQCPLGCETCTNIDHCNNCIDKYYMNSLNTLCVTNCDSDEYIESKYCKKCLPNCKICNNYTVCEECNKDYFIATNKTCVKSCEDNEFLNLNKCFPCPKNCEKCLNSYYCDKCVKNYYLSWNDTAFCKSSCEKREFSLNGKCFQCPLGCETCTSIDYCTNCLDNYYLNSLNKMCVINCESDEYIEKETKSCKKCMTNCKLCSNFTICNECNNKYFIAINNTCVQSCENNEYMNVNKCFLCPKNCDKCLNSSLCNQCSNNYYLSSSDFSSCKSSCESNEYIKEGKCLNCPSFCSSCENSTYCKTCESNYLMNSNGIMCTSQCESNEFKDNNLKKCTKCMDGCLSCTNSTKCLICNLTISYLSTISTCVNSCNSNEYDIEKKCYNCPENCNKCLNSSLCLSCNKDFSISSSNSSICTSKCEINEYISSGKCIKCPIQCSTCQNETYCSTCSDNNYLNLEGNMCESNCKYNEFINKELNQCFQCLKNCKACNNKTHCLTCEQNYFLATNNTCVTSCQSNEFLQNNQCFLCPKNCELCINSSICKLCTPYYYISSSNSSLCLSICNYHEYPLLGKCYQCPQKCDTCQNETFCSSCLSNYLMNFEEKMCVSQCQEGEYPELGKCKKCSKNCLHCTNDKICNLCTQNFFISKDFSCHKKCQIGEFNDLEGNCMPCGNNCINCLNNNICKKCKENYFLSLSNNCVSSCEPDQTVEDFTCKLCDFKKNNVVFQGKCINCKLINNVHENCSDICGSGYLYNFRKELECNDGNFDDNDGCDKNCNIEQNYTCIRFNYSMPNKCIKLSPLICDLVVSPNSHEIYLVFNREINDYYLNKTKIDFKNLIEIKFENIQSQTDYDINFLNNGTLKINFNFSYSFNRNQLNVKLIYPSLIKDRNNISLTGYEIYDEDTKQTKIGYFNIDHYNKTTILPQYLKISEDSLKNIELIYQYSNNIALYTTLAGSIPMFLFNFLQLLWMLVDEMQIASFFILINVVFPTNANRILKIFATSNLEFLTELINKMFGIELIKKNDVLKEIKEEYQAPTRFNYLHISALYISNALEIILLIIGLHFIYLFFQISAYYIDKKKITNKFCLIIQKISNFYNYMILIRIQLIFFVKICFATFLQINCKKTLNSYYSWSYFISVGSILYIIFFLFILYRIMNNKHIINFEASYLKKYEGLFEGFQVIYLFGRNFFLIVCLKKLFFIIILVFFHDYPIIEISLLLILQFTFFIMLTVYDIFISKFVKIFLNLADFFLLISIITILIIHIFFRNRIEPKDIISEDDVEKFYILGWCLISFMLFLVAGFFICFNWKILKIIKRFWRIYWDKLLLKLKRKQRKFQSKLEDKKKKEIEMDESKYNKNDVSIITDVNEEGEKDVTNNSIRYNSEKNIEINNNEIINQSNLKEIALIENKLL